MKLKYELKFYDYWHLGSGLSAGAKLDSTVVKDTQDIPYAPAKTIKGLAREMAELTEDSVFIDKCFGAEGVDIAHVYFSNAVLNEQTHKEIVTNSLQERLYDVIASTQIKDGIAVDNSLREIEVVIPISLYGEIDDIESLEDFNKLATALKMIKRVGLNRNRGLGRCEFIVEDVK